MSVNAISLRVPIITLVIVATVLPVELQPLNSAKISFHFGATDTVANIAAYIMVGIVFAEFGWGRALAAAAILSSLAEASQMMMVNRVASVADVTTNLSGAALGVFLGKRFRLHSPTLTVNLWRSMVAVGIAIALFVGTWDRSGRSANARGFTAPGILEGQWNFDEREGGQVVDSSGHNLHGTLARGLQRVNGVRNGAVMFDGKRNVGVGRATAFRLVGSMTVSAWVNSTSYPRDDAAIVSTFTDGSGFQLDTTIDRGPRTIGFKLNDPCGDLIVRYGATPLVLGTWYHVTGVYDAGKQSLDVYLNGELDNGAVVGVVSGTQRGGREPLYIGRRSDRKGYEFSGAMDEVRIYSFALTKPEIVAVMSGAVITPPVLRPNTEAVTRAMHPAGRSNKAGEPCGTISDRADSAIPAASGLLGALVAFACIGLWPKVKFWLPCLTGLLAGGLMAVLAAQSLPSFNLWLVPLTSLVGAASVAVSRRRALADVGTWGGNSWARFGSG